MVERSGETKFILYRREGRVLMEGVAQFKYLGRPIDQTDDKWPAVQRNVKQVQRFWERLVKIL